VLVLVDLLLKCNNERKNKSKKEKKEEGGGVFPTAG